jgi:hypothetical protein
LLVYLGVWQAFGVGKKPGPFFCRVMELEKKAGCTGGTTKTDQLDTVLEILINLWGLGNEYE